MKFEKGPLSFREQIALLQERGMEIPDEDRAYNILSSISYYRLSAYWYTFYKLPQDDHQFKKGTNFENKLKQLLKDFPTLPLDYMGFPVKWEKDELWKEEG